MSATDDSDEATLQGRLDAATSAEERGRIHAALAVCAGRALAYRRMNKHEEASAWAYAERSEILADALRTYRAAIEAFGARRDDDGITKLRATRPVIVAELGDLHPYAQQVTNTLAGRASGASTLAERAELRRWLVAGSEALYGRTHTHTLQHLGRLAYVLAALGDSEGAMVAFEEAIDGLVLGPWPHEAATLLQPLAKLCHDVGTPHRSRPREQRVLAGAPSSAATVRGVFFRRSPTAARHFDADALRHGATHFPALADAALAAIDGAPFELPEARDGDAATDAFVHAITAFDASGTATLCGDWVLRALAALDTADRPLSEDSEPTCTDDEPEGERARAERERQDAMFRQLFEADASEASMDATSARSRDRS